MPASHHEKDDFIFAKEYPNQSGHPIRITMFKPPKDGEAIIGWSTAAIERPLAHGSASVLKPSRTASLAYVYERETKADADIAKMLTIDEARHIVSNIAKLPKFDVV